MAKAYQTRNLFQRWKLCYINSMNGGHVGLSSQRMRNHYLFFRKSSWDSITTRYVFIAVAFLDRPNGQCVQMLLRPTIAIRKAATYYAPLCAESAACCCEVCSGFAERSISLTCRSTSLRPIPPPFALLLSNCIASSSPV